LLVFILPVFLFIVQNTIQNKHTHFYPNGIVITHSHPIPQNDGEPKKEHDHTKTEICFFHQVNFNYFTYPHQFEIPRAFVTNQLSYFLFNERKITSLCTELPVNRGPPSFLL
jgi:hypothetical protein